MTVEERFWNKVEKTDGCWLWLACTDRDGYGIFQLDGRAQKAHRVAYENLVGAIPVELQIDHLCRNRACVNPEHLEPVTCRENLLRGETHAARNTRKTHCPSGHSFSGENLYSHNGERLCRECQRRAAREYQRRRRAV